MINTRLIKALYLNDGTNEVYSKIDNSSNSINDLNYVIRSLSDIDKRLTSIEDVLSSGRVEFYQGDNPEKIESGVIYAKYHYQESS